MLARKMFIGLAALVILAVATPAMADEFKGWYGVLDLALTQPAGLDQNYATHVQYPSSNTISETERLVLDNDDSLDFTAAFGYSFGKMGMLQVSYWGTSGNDSFEDSVTGDLYPTVAGYNPTFQGGYLSDYYGDGYTLPIEFEAESDTTATIWDIDYIRPMAAGEKFSVNWIAGFRVAEFKENVFFDGSGVSPGIYGPVDVRYIQKRHISSSGWGFKVGATANMDFTKHFGLEAALAVSFLQGTSEGSSTFCDGACGTSTDQYDTEGSDDSMRAEIRDYGLAAVWHQGPVDIFAGFKSSNWDGLPANPDPASSSFVRASGKDRNDVTFNSWHVGAKWKIGG